LVSVIKGRTLISGDDVMGRFRLKRKEIAVGWRRLHNEELQNFYTSPVNIKVIKSRRRKWAGHVARMREVRSTKFCS